MKYLSHYHPGQLTCMPFLILSKSIWCLDIPSLYLHYYFQSEMTYCTMTVPIKVFYFTMTNVIFLSIKRDNCCLTLSLQNFFYQNLHAFAEFSAILFLAVGTLLQNSHKHRKCVETCSAPSLNIYAHCKIFLILRAVTVRPKKVERPIDTV